MTTLYRKLKTGWIGQKVAHAGAYCGNELFPVVCALCGKVGESVCGQCYPFTQVLWTHINHPLVSGLPVFYLKKYTNSVFRSLVLSSKYHQRPDVIEKVINSACGYLPVGPDVGWVPVPVSRQRFAQRGYNQAEYIARHLADCYGGTVQDVLRVTIYRQSAHAVGSSRHQRLQGHPMRARPAKTTVSNVWLVDDVITTGGTSRDAVRALTGAGYAVRGIVTICCTPLGCVARA